MSVYGWQAVNWVSGWQYYGQNFENNVSSGTVSMPESGTVTDIFFNCDQTPIGGSGPMFANGCLWDASGNLLVAGSQVTLASAGQHSGPYSWHDSTCNYVIAQGTQFRMGWWRSPNLGAGSNIFGYTNGSMLLGTTSGSSGPGSFGQDGSFGALTGIYIVYTPSTPPVNPTPPITQNQQIGVMRTIGVMMEQGLIPK